MKTIWIGDHEVGEGAPCLIIAEAGVNHNGDPGVALQLIAAARDSGADVVKFQTWITDKLVAPQAGLADYQKASTSMKGQFDLLKGLELKRETFRDLKAMADRLGILFLSTPDEEDSADFLEQLGVAAFKVGSAEVTNLPLLRHIATKKRPMILSTGMATLGEVEAAVDTIERAGNSQLVLLHCVTAYPARIADCNLRSMETLRRAFGYPVGFSDHTTGLEAAAAAVALGASVIEKHFTLDRGMKGPDHAASVDIEGLRRLVQTVRDVASALGDGVKRPTTEELRNRTVVQKVLVATRRIRAGTVINEADVVLRRAASGLPAVYLAAVVGRKARFDIEEMTPIVMENLT